jgi:serine/threonine protein kinase
MSDTDAARWPKIQKLFREAMRLPAGERDAFVEHASGDDAELLASVRKLLAASDTDIGLSRIVGSAAAFAAGGAGADNDGLLHQRVGNYQLVELLGVGGMGSVYLGKRIDEQFEHEVAIKVLRTSGPNENFAERFRSERQVLANLNHPNIARLLDGGVTDNGLQYLVMEYVRGEAIDYYSDTRRLDIRRRLRLFQKICLAVDYAHRNLVIHRDVKPSNILVTDDGVPKLLDFGIAKVLPADSIAPLTVESQRLMTPEYASPEQVRGEPVSTATDVYSLGVLLYRLLCGRGPYRVPNDLPSGLARAILESSPNKPSTVLETPVERPGDERSGDAISAERQSTVFGWLWLGEALTPLEALGGLFVITGIALASRARPPPAPGYSNFRSGHHG